MKHIFLTICCLAAGIISATYAEPLRYSITHYTAEDGLSQNTVMYMMQDHKGLMWLASWDGLNVFNGYEFTVYKALAGDHVNLSNNRILTIDADRYGYIWLLAYDYRVHRFDPRTEQFEPISATGYEALNIKRITVLPSGSVWLHGDQDEAIRVTTDSVTHATTAEVYSSQSGLFPSQHCYLVHEDSDGNEWLLSDNGIGVIPRGGTTPERFFTASYKSREKNLQAFYALAEDTLNIWTGSDNGRIWQYVKADKSFELHQLPSTSRIKSIDHIGKSGKLFITTENDGVFVYTPANGTYEHYSAHNTPLLAGCNIKQVFIDSHNEVWIDPGRPQEVLHYNPERRQFKQEIVPIKMSIASQTNPFFLILEDERGIVWVQPDGSGLCYYDRDEEKLYPLFYDQEELNTTNRVHSAFTDRQGNLWICTYTKGLDKLSFHNNPIRIKRFDKSNRYSLDSDVRSIFESSRGDVFIGLRNGTLQVYAQDGTYKGILTHNGTVSPHGKALDIAVYNMVEDDENRLWIATKGNGLFCATPVAPDKYHITQYRHSASDIYSLSNDDLYYLHIDKSQHLWIATYGGGLNYLDIGHLDHPVFINHRNYLKKYPINECDRVRIIGEDSIGNIWAGTTAGVLMFDSNFGTPDEITFKHYVRNAYNPNSLSANDVHYIHTTRDGELYLATFGGGLNKLRTDGDSTAIFDVYTHTDGLPSDVLLAIAEDSKGNLWISTENGLSKFDPSKRSFENYGTNEISPQPRFNESVVENIGHEIAFGNSNGIVIFDPDSLHKSDYAPLITFTRLLLANRPVSPGKDKVLEKVLDETDELRLEHDQNIFTIQYAAIDMRMPQDIQYAYMLDGFEKEWNYVGEQRSATYTNLPKGTYHFKVRSTNSDGIWVENERSLTIEILPSFWETPWAWALYILAFILFMGIVIYIFTTIYKLKNEVTIEQQVSDIKLRFFTNISHELRTPLTLIAGPIEHILSDPDLKEDIYSQLQLVKKNTARMLRLVNQILDFRKIQNKKMRMRVSEVNIIPFVKQTMQNFNSLAEEHNIQYDLQTSLHESYLWVDTDKLDKILFNLLSNAFKYTPQGKSITVFVEDKEKQVAIGVRDEGIGIADNQRDRLFVRFETLLDHNIFSQPTTGIGLSLVKELVEMHKGYIEVESTPGKGSCFTVYLPKGRNHYDKDVEYILEDLPTPADVSRDESNALPDYTAGEQGAEEGASYSILLVEDNSELLAFLKSIFSHQYKVIEATDGRDGVEKARVSQPDIIISDLMMPNLDGIGLIRELRQELSTSHIPIILLTAKSTIESKIAGLEEGADDYITKPFSAAYLQARVENLLQQRRQLREFYRTNLGEQEPENPISALPVVDGVKLTLNDRKFLERLLELMEKNISNGDLVVDDFVQEMAVSRSVFFKKLKALTGLAPIEFIKEMRIKRAAQLIKQGDYTMTQIAYMVGINDPRYFSKCFKQYYEMTPTEYKESLKK